MNLMKLTRAVIFILLAINFFLILAFGSFFTVHAQGWRGIVPLRTSKAEVERKFKVKGEEIAGYTEYKLPKNKVVINYSVGKCAESPESEWDIEKDTVISVSIYPLTGLTLRDLKIDVGNFEKRSLSMDLPSVFTYVDVNSGFSVTVDTHSRMGADGVADFGYYPPKKFSNLKCPKSH